MPGRVEYFDDPSAPIANSLVVAVTAIVTNDDGDLLMQKRTDNDLWGLPGGAMNIGESIGQAVTREVLEETALQIQPTGIVGIYSDPGHIIAYADGEVRQEFSICFTARIVGGQLTVGDTESTEVRFVKRSEIEQLSMGRSTRIRIQHFLERRTLPYFA
ncbi:MAG: NUDIX domain-containing protein [Chloroflexi bacterium]|nr:NUDIX domain-containing protein [Solirubrobacterales bacterium]MBV9327480.1 NUDIX domain-containing protein [Chloroflexota bacterium]MBV9602098.1 NUDIX domain-containing protein [Chloroflexota bacterium]